MIKGITSHSQMAGIHSTQRSFQVLVKNPIGITPNKVIMPTKSS